VLRLAPLVLLAACGGGAAEVTRAPAAPVYQGIETRLLDGDLVSFAVTMQGGDAAAVETYARCAAAEYTLIRGYGFARHVRTVVDDGSGIWRADAVYTISPGLPAGLRTIDAEVVAAQCRQAGIPTV
jgi:hypothetical protein